MLSPVSPEQGQAVMFSSGWENYHYVDKLTGGVRYAVPAFFTTEAPTDVGGTLPAPFESGDDAGRARALYECGLMPLALVGEIRRHRHSRNHNHNHNIVIASTTASLSATTISTTKRPMISLFPTSLSLSLFSSLSLSALCGVSRAGAAPEENLNKGRSN